MVIITMDEFQSSKKMMNEARKRWLLLHRNSLDRWIYNNISYDETKTTRNKAISDERLIPFFYSIVKQDEEYNFIKLEKMLEPFKNRGHILLVVGKRNSGKTVLAYLLSEMLHKEYNDKIWWFGLPSEFPSFIENSTFDFNKIPENTTTILDESSVQFYNRLSATRGQRDVMRQLPIIRHSRRNFIVITQGIDIMDVAFLKNTSSIIWTSPIKFQFLDKERRETVDSSLDLFIPREKGKALYYSDDNLFQFEFLLPDWWKEEYSTPYSRLRSRAKAIRIITILLSEGIDSDTIKTQLSMRGMDISVLELEQIRELLNRTDPAILSLPDSELLKLIEMGFDDTPLGETKKGRKYSFRQTPIQEREWNIRLGMKPDLAITSTINVNSDLLSEIKDGVKRRNIILSISGQTGSGKSWASISMAELIAKLSRNEFEFENVCFSSEELLNRLKNVKERTTLIMDEQIRSWGCFDSEETKILIKTINGIEKRRIKDLIDNTFSKRFRVISYNEKEKKLEDDWAMITENKEMEMLQFITDKGNKIEVTEDHPLIIMRNGLLKKIRAGSIIKGDTIANLKHLLNEPGF